MNGSTGEDGVEEAILAYLREQPHAMDTLDGIAEWWLERRRVALEVDTVHRALQRLLDRGLLEKVVLTGSPPGTEPQAPARPLYRLRA